MTTSGITKLRNGAEAMFCSVRVFRRKDYRCFGKPVRYAFVYEHGEHFASNLTELRTIVRHHEDARARRKTEAA
jgi:hypothetical protein